MTGNSDDCMNVVETTKLRVAHAYVILPELRKKSNQTQAEVKSCGNISYRRPVWSAAAPPPALCQQTLQDGSHRAPLPRTQAGRTRAAPPQTGSGFRCPWCLLVAHSSSGRLYTAGNANGISSTAPQDSTFPANSRKKQQQQPCNHNLCS